MESGERTFGANVVPAGALRTFQNLPEVLALPEVNS